ncbi:histidine kinase [Actinomycetes bacterium KLBMP 9797]
MTTTRRTTTAAGLLLGLAVAEVAVTVVAGWLSELSFGALTEGFAVSNATLGLALAVAGWPIARHRPGNPIGWLLLTGGICYATSAAGAALLAAGTEPGEAAAGWRVLATVTNLAWTWTVTVVLPVVLLTFPDGRLLGRAGRAAVGLATAGGLLFAAMAVVPAHTLSSDEYGVTGYLSTGAEQLAWVGAVSALAGTAVYVAALASLAVRYRRGDERVRRQLLWLLLGALVMVASFAVSDLLGVDSWLSIYSIALVPFAIMIAILRHRLLDIRLVVSRSVLYLALTAGVVAAYAALVTVLDSALRQQVGLGSSVLATLLIAGAFHPARLWLQRRVDRIFYGARHDPVRAIAEVGAQLGDAGGSGLDGALRALRVVMRLPSAQITAGDQRIAAYGVPPALRQAIPLVQGGEAVGELTVGLRAGESRLDPADERILHLLSASLAVAVRATLLAQDLGQAREALVTAREEERRRLRRDLHDGLGPALTGVVLNADVARRLVPADPDRAVALLADLRAKTTAAIDDIRRLVNDLRPPALDGLGLTGALREHAATLAGRPDDRPLRIDVDAAEPLGPLPAAVEVAAYRIATEALTNVVRHSRATRATVTLRVEPAAFTLTVYDNGADGTAAWRAGVGLTSMTERAAELGGHCVAGPGADGGRVHVTIPLGGGGGR